METENHGLVKSNIKLLVNIDFWLILKFQCLGNLPNFPTLRLSKGHWASATQMSMELSMHILATWHWDRVRGVKNIYHGFLPCSEIDHLPDQSRYEFLSWNKNTFANSCVCSHPSVPFSVNDDLTRLTVWI